MFIADCPICKESLGGDKTPVTMPCGHVYCLDCATFWFNQGDTQKCICGRVFKGEDIIRLWYSSENQSTCGSPAERSAREHEGLRPNLLDACKVALTDIDTNPEGRNAAILSALQTLQDFVESAANNCSKANMKSVLRDVRLTLAYIMNVLSKTRPQQITSEARYSQKLTDALEILADTRHQLQRMIDEKITVQRRLSEQLALSDEREGELRQQVNDLKEGLRIARRHLTKSRESNKALEELAAQRENEAKQFMTKAMKYKKWYHVAKNQERTKKRTRMDCAVDGNPLIVLEPTE
ncbi:hypothetical protein BC835DRAFT_1329529 [Cytidiella melzeri]|nr:hypothetical protein BC835DRAFT_1329529 [Cytidiella melzeri]